MKKIKELPDTTKTIIIGTVTTILVLILVIFILYKVSDTKEEKNSNNTISEKLDTLNENNIPASKEENNTDTNQSNTNEQNTSSNSSTIKDDEANSKVILYMFHGSTCPHCVNAISKIKDERNTTFKNVEIRTFEVWKNEDNGKLYDKVNEKLNVNVNSVPYFIIGDYNKVGFNAETLLTEYKKALNNKDYKDIVEEVIKENPELNTVYETI